MVATDWQSLQVLESSRLELGRHLRTSNEFKYYDGISMKQGFSNRGV
jgi:hypothetical protein